MVRQGGGSSLGFQGIVEEEPYRRLFRGFTPGTEKPLVAERRKARPSSLLESCFSSPKSLGVLWSQASPEVRTAIERIHDNAVDAALQILEQKFAFSRAGKASEGSSYIPVGVVVSIFQHASSRAKDPNLHSHAVLHNVGVDNKWNDTRAIHTPPIFRAKMLLGAYYRAKLAEGLRAELGLLAEQEGRSFGIQGVPRPLVKFYSKRRKRNPETLGGTWRKRCGRRRQGRSGNAGEEGLLGFAERNHRRNAGRPTRSTVSTTMPWEACFATAPANPPGVTKRL